MDYLQLEVIDTVIRKVNKNKFGIFTKLPTVDRGIWSHLNHEATKLAIQDNKLSPYNTDFGELKIPC